MSGALAILGGGALLTLQDAGRLGYQRFGVSQSGAMDRTALAIANRLVGNPPDSAVIEIALAGGALRIEADSARLALAGADMPLSADGRTVALYCSHTLPRGATLAVGACRAGLRAYLAVEGGFAVAPELGSLATDKRNGIGGMGGGRALDAGTMLPLKRDAASPRGEILLPRPQWPAYDRDIRVVLGPQDDYFTAEGIATFLGSDYTLTPAADRMGGQFAGPQITHAKGYNIVSDGIVTGSIQVPGSGQPIVMMADRQTTGGYPKIATVIGADQPKLAQLRPGDAVRFRAVSVAAAQEARRQWLEWLAALPEKFVPAREIALDSEALLAANLISGAIAGDDI